MSLWLLIGCTSIDWCERFNLECSESVTRAEPIDADEDVWPAETDCDDNDPYTYPYAPELCDGIDNNCDGVDDISEGLATWLYLDFDNDGFGDPAQSAFHCIDKELPDGWVNDNTDCDDSRIDISPAADESSCPQSLDGLDNDCDGTIDEGELSTFYIDRDGDGQGSDDKTIEGCQPGKDYSRDSYDCNDDDARIYQGATELCDNLDNDCDGSIDEDQCTSVLATVGVVLSGESSADGAGRALAGLGDLNSDGYDDIAIGASGHDGGGESAGAAYVLYGPLSGDIALEDAPVRLLGAAAGDQLGRSLARLGDLNSDGRDDLLIGASVADDGRGTAYLLHGPLSAGDTLQSAAAQITGTDAEDYLGRAAAGLGDVDGDGARDFAIGAWGSDTSDADAGAVYVFSGPVTGSLTAADADGVLLGASSGDYAGWSLDGAGDVDGDGLQDIVIGAYNAMSGAGASYLVRGPISGSQSLSDAHAILIGEREEEYAGWSVAGAGDTNGDELGDLLIGAPRLSSIDQTWAGATWLAYGPISGTQSLSGYAAVIGTQASARVGFSVSGLADRDGDGLSEILIGAYGSSSPVPDSGSAYLLRSGGALPLTTLGTTDIADWTLSGKENGENAGVAVDDAGDVNGDGRSDLLVGAPERTETGAAYLIY